MSPFWKLAVLLLCIHRGEGHRLRTLLDRREQTASPDQDQRGEPDAGRTEGSGFDLSQNTGSPPARGRRSSPDPASCGLRSVLLQVRDLGLGYDSDETVLFKYCGGTCERARSNHDLTLANLLQSGLLGPAAHGTAWHGAACCRPTHHEDLAFLDNTHRWHKVEKLSAAGCSCVG